MKENFVKYLNTAEAANLAGLSQSYLNKLRSTGGGSPFLKIGRRCVYRDDQFRDWLSSHERLSASSEVHNA